LYYVSSPSGIIAVMEKKNSTSTIYYLHTDHLGSFDVVSNPDGIVKERYFRYWWDKESSLSNSKIDPCVN